MGSLDGFVSERSALACGCVKIVPSYSSRHHHHHHHHQEAVATLGWLPETRKCSITVVWLLSPSLVGMGGADRRLKDSEYKKYMTK